MKIKPFILFLLLIIAEVICAQEQRLFETISVSDGMPHSEVTSIVQDKVGFLWFGTLNGLTRYDGNVLKTFTKSITTKSMNSLRILSLCADGDSVLYIGTEGGGLTIFNTWTETFSHYTHSTDRNSLPSDIVCSITQGLEGHIWIGTANGLCLLQKKNGKVSFKRYSASLHMVTQLRERAGGVLLVTSKSGFYEVNTRTHQVKQILPDHSSGICQIEADVYLIGSDNGLFRYELPDKISHIPTPPVEKVHIGSNEDIWVGTLNDGLYKFNTKLQLTANYQYGDILKSKGLSNNGIRSFFEDFSGNLWIGTQNGVNKLTLGEKEFEQFNAILDKNVPIGETIKNKTATFFEDENQNLWIGSQAAGLRILNRKTQEIQILSPTVAPELAHATISSFFEDKTGALWIGTWDRLFVLPPSERKKIGTHAPLQLTDVFKKFNIRPTSIFKIIEDKDGELWMSTTRGIYRYTPSAGDYYNGTFSNYSNSASGEKVLTDNFLTDIFIDQVSPGATKIVWAGSSNGLNKIIVHKNEITPIAIHADAGKNGLKGEFISVIHQDKEDNLWILSIDGYLNKLTGNRYSKLYPQFQSFNFNEDGTFDTTESLQEDDYGNFWMGGIRLIRFNPKMVTLRYFDKQDGLENSSFKIWSSYKLRSGELVFGGINGFSIFNPNRFKENKILPQMAFTNLSIFDTDIKPMQPYNGKIILDKSLNETERITLPYDMNSINLSFAAMHFVSPSKNHYKYMLEGEDKNWRYTTGNKNNAIYTHLSPGIYTFKVYGSNCDNQWCVQPRMMEIEITPPFWETTAAYIFYVCLFFYLMYLFRRSLILKEKRKNALLLEHTLREEESKVHQMKLRFFTDISHELKTPLTLIHAPIEELVAEPSISSQARRKLMFVRKNAARLMELVEQIMDFRKYDNQVMKLHLTEEDLADLCRNVMHYFEDEAERRDVTFTFEAGKEFTGIVIDKEKIEKVLFNIIGNAFKYIENGGEISVRCTQNDTADVTIQIKDNGSGIREKDIHRMFERFYQGEKTAQGGTGIGLALAKAIVDQHKGDIWVESEFGKGAAFYVKLLAGKSHFNEEDIESFSAEKSTLPGAFYLQRNDESDALDAAVSEIPSPDKTTGKRSKILIVEDNRELCAYLEESLAPAFTVRTAENGEQAYQIALKEEIDLIVSDVMMPVMDGFELCNEVKNDINASHIPFILLTAQHNLQSRLKGLNNGADAYMEKPFSIELLVAQVQNLLKSRELLSKTYVEKPNTPVASLAVSPVDDLFLRKLNDYLDEQLSSEALNVEMLSEAMGMSTSSLYRKVKGLSGLSPIDFIKITRLKKAVQLMQNGESRINEIAFQVGFSSPAYFSTCFQKQYGKTPTEFVRKE